MALVDKNKLDGVRAKGFGLLGRLGVVGGTLAKVNDALGRPLAPSEELADRRAFETGQPSNLFRWWQSPQQPTWWRHRSLFITWTSRSAT